MTLYADERLTTTQDVEDGLLYTHWYPCPHGTTALSENINRGTISPLVQYAEVMSSELAFIRGTDRLALVVKSFLTRLYTGVARTDVLRELEKSRIKAERQHGIAITRRFEIAKSSMTDGALGWTWTSKPVKGDVYPFGTWTITPRVGALDIDMTFTTSKALVTIQYFAVRPQ